MDLALSNSTYNIAVPINSYAYLHPNKYKSPYSHSIFKRDSHDHLHHLHHAHKPSEEQEEGSGDLIDDTEESDDDFIIDNDPNETPFDFDFVNKSIAKLDISIDPKMTTGPILDDGEESFDFENGSMTNSFNISMNSTGNNTMTEHRAHWKTVLDNVVKYIMMFNVVGLMLGMGCAIYWREIIKNLWPPIGICIGMLGQFILLPATGFGFSVLFELKPYEALGCLIVSCSPGGTFSNFFTYWVDGDLALSIVMTSCSALIAFGGMPFNLWLYSSHWVSEDESESIVIPFKSIFRSLAFVCGPVVVGMIIRHFSEKVAKIITRVTSIVGYMGFLTVLTSWVLLYYKMFMKATPLIYCSAVILPITGFTLAYLIAFVLRREHKVCRTIGIETGSQNMPVALSIVLMSFDDPEVRSQMLLFPTLYGVFMLCEVFLGIGVYTGVKFCMNRNKEKNYPEKMQATLETGAPIEMERLKS